MYFAKAFGSLFLIFVESGLAVPPLNTMDYISRQIFKTSQLCQKQAPCVQSKGCGCFGTWCQLGKSLPAVCFCKLCYCGSKESVCLWMFLGAWEWEHLQEALEEKLKNSLAVAQLMERIRSLIGRDRVSSLMFEKKKILSHNLV